MQFVAERKIMIILFAFLAIFAIVAPLKIFSSAEVSEPAVSVEIKTPQDFLNQEQNFVYRARISQRVTRDGKYLLRRYANLISVESLQLEIVNPIIIAGDNFIITDDNEIWFVNKDRIICRFSCDDHDFTKNNEPEIVVSNVYADVKKGDVKEFSFDFNEPKGELAIATVNGTLLFDKSNLSLERLGKKIDTLTLPSPVKEISLITDWYGGASARSHIVYAVIYENNSLATITVDDYGLHGKQIFNSKNSEPVSFLKASEENHIDEIVTREGYVFFYVGDVLHLSNGRHDILVDDLPWEQIWQFGDSSGPGKCLDPYAAFWAKSEVPAKDFDLKTELDKTQIKY